MGKTIIEKILGRAAGQDTRAGEFVTSRPDVIMVHEALIGSADVLDNAGVEVLEAADRAIAVFDHYVPAPNELAATIHQHGRRAVERWKIGTFYGERAGIAHQVLVEKGHIKPGDLAIGSDSHSTTYGAVGAAGTGIATTEMAWLLATGELWFEVPPTIRIELEGRLGSATMSKDLVLRMLADEGTAFGLGKALEYGGPGLTSLSVAARMTLSNMAVEMGADFGICEADEVTREFLEPLGAWRDPVLADADADYVRTVRYDLGDLEPQVAMPYSPGNVKAAREVSGVKVNQALIGSCTNARLEDLAAAAEVLRGRRIADHVRLYVNPASTAVYREAMRAGYIDVFLDAGAVVGPAGCGPCFGAHGGLLGPEEVCIATINRNFQGRMGATSSKVFLASPLTVAASAITGYVTDPREVVGDGAVETAGAALAGVG